MKVLVRVSLNQDVSSVIGTELRTILEDAGFERMGTGNFIHEDIARPQLAQVMQDYWARIGQGDVQLDHVWIACATDER